MEEKRQKRKKSARERERDLVSDGTKNSLICEQHHHFTFPVIVDLIHIRRERERERKKENVKEKETERRREKIVLPRSLC